MEKGKKIKISKKSRKKRKREKKNQPRSRAKLLYSFCGKRMMKGRDKDEYQSSFPPHRCSISSVNAIQNGNVGWLTENGRTGAIRVSPRRCYAARNFVQPSRVSTTWIQTRPNRRRVGCSLRETASDSHQQQP